MAESKPRGQSNAGGNKAFGEGQVTQGRPRYGELCISTGRCVEVKTCGDVVGALSVLGIDDDDLVEIVVRALCRGDEQ
jgi:hypothetical protein